LKKLVFLALMVCTVLLVPGCTKKAILTLYSWDEMFPLEVLSGFEKETGIRINYVNFDTGETMLMRLQAANGGSYDLIIVDDYIIDKVVEQGLAQKLNTSRISNYRNINPKYQKQFYDMNDEYTVPYGAGVQTIVYNPRDVQIEIKGYRDLWDASLVNSIGLIGNFRVINGMALKVLGASYNTNDLSEIRTAGIILKNLAPNVRLIRDDDIQAELISGEISAAVMYTSQVTDTMLQAPNMRMVFPVEGIGFGIMAAFVPLDAPNLDAAYAFLDYILDAQRGAACFEYLGYYSTWSASDSFIRAEMRDLLTLPEGFNIDMEMIQNISPEAEELHDLVWTEFRAACGQ